MSDVCTVYNWITANHTNQEAAGSVYHQTAREIINKTPSFNSGRCQPTACFQQLAFKRCLGFLIDEGKMGVSDRYGFL